MTQMMYNATQTPKLEVKCGKTTMLSQIFFVLWSSGQDSQKSKDPKLDFNITNSFVCLSLISISFCQLNYYNEYTVGKRPNIQ